MLSGTRLSNDAPLTHASREQNLSQRVVDFVRAGVKQVLALEIDPRTTAIHTQTMSEEQRCRASSIIAQQLIEFTLKALVFTRQFIRRRQFFERRHQSLRHEATAVTTPVPERIWLGDCVHFKEIRGQTLEVRSARFES